MVGLLRELGFVRFTTFHFIPDDKNIRNLSTIFTFLYSLGRPTRNARIALKIGILTRKDDENSHNFPTIFTFRLPG